jgi:hypothetical protein
MKPRISLWERGFFVRRRLSSSITSCIRASRPDRRRAPIYSLLKFVELLRCEFCLVQGGKFTLCRCSELSMQLSVIARHQCVENSHALDADNLSKPGVNSHFSRMRIRRSEGIARKDAVFGAKYLHI